MARRPLSRRLFLGGAAGSLLALPLLQLTSERAGASKFPTRLVIFYSPNGTIYDAWKPIVAPDGFALGPIMAPLKPHKDKLIILDGIDAESSYHGPGDSSHWNGMGHLLTGTELVEGPAGVFWGGGVSVDQHIAAQIGGDTKLPSLQLAVEENYGDVSSRLSYLGAAQPIPPESDPRKAFERIFGEPPADVRAARLRVLDGVHQDLTALSAQLPKEDRRKLEEHADAVRGIEHELEMIADAPSCAPDAYVNKTEIKQASTYPAVGKVQMDLLVAALACDITRVASLQWSRSVSMVSMTWIGVNEAHHDLSHASVGDAGAQGKLALLGAYYAAQLAYLIAKMDSVPEGEGTLLDHSLVLWCSEIADGPTHSRRSMPFVLAGGAGGHLKTGRWLKYGGAAQNHVHNGLLISICEAMGAPVATFGNPAYCYGPLPYLTG